MSGPTLRLATRGSPLALRQVALVAEAFGRVGADVLVEPVVVETLADRRLDVAIGELAGRGAFTNEVDAVVAAGDADGAVHSLKDLPSQDLHDGLVFAAVLARGEVRDCLVGSALDALSPGARVATGAPRRRAQIAAMRPDLTFAPLRGNIGTRLARVPDGGALVVALAALERLGLLDAATEIFSAHELVPQVGQGAIALRCRGDDEASAALLGLVDDEATHRAVTAERSFLRRLGGGCDAPVGAHATVTADGLEIEALIASGDGHIVLRRRLGGTDATALGTAVAEALLFDDGASELFEVTR